MTTDVSCLIGERTAELASASFDMLAIPRAEWYGPPSEAEILTLDGTVLDGRVMAQIVLCGENAGQFQSLVAEDGVPFTNGYEDLPFPILAGADSRYINDRLENPLTVVDAAGRQSAIAAGKAGFMHSPDPSEPGGDAIETVEDLLQWHDREWATVAMEAALVRYRLHEVVHAGRTLLVARGSVVPGLTNGAVWALAQSEVSPEFIPVTDEATGATFLEYVALSHVFHGNTNTSLNASLAASLPDRALASAGSLVRNVSSIGKADAMADATPCSCPPANLADAQGSEPEVSAELAALSEENAALREQNAALIAEQFDAIVVDASPLR